MLPEQPDFRSIVSDFEQLSANWAKRSQEFTEAMVADAAVVEHEDFVLTLSGTTQISSLAFTASAVESSPVQLRQAILDAVARLVVGAANNQAAAVARIMEAPELGQQMRAAVPVELREQAGDDSEELSAAAAASAPSAPSGSRPPADLNEVLAWADDVADGTSVVSEDPIEIMADVEGWTPAALDISADEMLRDLHRDVRAMVAAAESLPALIQQIEVESASKHLTVTVNGGGRLVNITFRPGFRGATAEELTDTFAELYQTAQAEASQQVFATVRAAGLGLEDDPTVELLTPTQPGV